MSSTDTEAFVAEKNTVWLVYILHVLGFFTGGVTSIAAIIVNYVKLGDLRDPVALSHFRWQIRTFWWGLLWGVVSTILVYFIVGLIGFVVLFFWYVYRLIIGMVKLNDGKAMYS